MRPALFQLINPPEHLLCAPEAPCGEDGALDAVGEGRLDLVAKDKVLVRHLREVTFQIRNRDIAVLFLNKILLDHHDFVQLHICNLIKPVNNFSTGLG